MKKICKVLLNTEKAQKVPMIFRNIFLEYQLFDFSYVTGVQEYAVECHTQVMS